LTGEKKEIENYGSALEAAKAVILKYAWVSSICLGILLFGNIGCYALGFWYGSVLIVD
jgi:hypothetical protein